MNDVVVVGGGMAGLSAAWVAARAGLAVTLLEQANEFGEVGAGIQLGPNAVRVLEDWGMGQALRSVAAFPDDLVVRDGMTGRQLGRLTLGEAMRSRYGRAYATIHRADLHRLLLEQVQPMVVCQLNHRVERIEVFEDAVRVNTLHGTPVQAKALLGCDGLWSAVRQQVFKDGTPQYSGHLAYRGMVHMTDLPAGLQRNQVAAWLAPGMHAVHYPVRGGDWMNLVVVVEGAVPADRQSWDQAAHAAHLRQALGKVHPELEGVIQAVNTWRLWPLNARAPMSSAMDMVRGRVALLGDAAHPMRPYLAQGAAMALEDAWLLGQLLERAGAASGASIDWSALLDSLAQQRWRRAAWVQERSRRNGVIFHMAGPMRWARDWAMRRGGERLLDQPSLYSGPPLPL